MNGICRPDILLERHSMIAEGQSRPIFLSEKAAAFLSQASGIRKALVIVSSSTGV